MRVALLTYSTKPRGGVVHTLALAEALAGRGHEVEVWTLARGGDAGFFREVDPAVTVRAVPFPEVEGESVGERIDRSITVLGGAFDSAAEVVHAQDCISANAVGERGWAHVRTIHHLDAFTTERLIRCHDRAIREPAARICVSAAVAAEVREQYGPAPTVIPNGVAAERFARAAGPEGAAARARWQGRLGRYVLALGGIEPRKGTIDLLEAYARVRDRYPDVELVLGGGETLFDYRPYRARFEERARELGVEPVLLGTLPDDEVPPLVAGAEVLGFVSTKEGFGLAALEALAAGVPVIARDIPVIREVFGDAVHRAPGTVEGIASGLDTMLAGARPDPRRGRALAASFTWGRAAELHERFYRHVLEHGGDAGAPVDLADHR